MKKILVFSHAMEIGGAERALLGLLETIDTMKYEVDLFLMRHQGELMKYIPSNINLLPEIPKYACLAIPFIDVLKRGQFGVAIGRYVGKRKAAKRVKKLQLSADNDVALEYSHKFTIGAMPLISDKEYDLAISFLTPHYFCAKKVKAKKRIAWIHTDYTNVSVDMESELRMWSQYDHIMSVSENVTESFLKVFPSMRSKILQMENIMPTKYMASLTGAFLVEGEMLEDGSIKLLTIGRFSHAKNMDQIPMICRRIRELGINIKWYLIGFGIGEVLIRQRITETEMQEYVIILGKKENPYPYIKACDIYVQPSRYEGKSIAVREAQALNKPVVITNYSTAQSQLHDGYDGVIVPMDNEGCAEGIADVINNKELQNKICENMRKCDYMNLQEIEKLYGLLEG